ncbi:glycoside hydrolase family 25 protein [Streptomyces antimycoticus]|uniref:Glycoside hydrolase family 25 protein n=2 Tax=Streptomyces violaceusniger group TaxID=2839105 RepID=A0ABD5J972_9ACTN|nr:MULTISPECIES: glycoside hydrolase family 25 protein [Streptomyces]MEE4584940.1 glycoside hydrolase family 25 protein [Streptomyces sp. DSM 41602]AJZ82848.1 glycoside hydrolase family 25 protein [Streptomyces sp. AgN23]KUL61899.1 muramidase [Streptomyces violaceusniger]RSS33140.1 muramidase [Streptomyces sp. WAC05858]WJD97057.1 glycoside hydrolase family 25 protein [Streptomyces antimycoticus]
MLHGIDVSSHQSTFDADGLAFVFIKATEGRSYINPKQSSQASRARKAGCVVGFYHFLWPGNITAQAQYFVEKCASQKHDLLAVDWETTGSGTRASNAEKDRFIREVKKLRPTHRVMLYCNRSFWLNYDTTSYAGDGLWIADYVTAGKPRIKAKWRIHQYTDRPLDKDVANFSSKAALRAWADPSRAALTSEETADAEDVHLAEGVVDDAGAAESGEEAREGGA